MSVCAPANAFSSGHNETGPLSRADIIMSRRERRGSNPQDPYHPTKFRMPLDGLTVNSERSAAVPSERPALS